jgi:hypothetical protein
MHQHSTTSSSTWAAPLFLLFFPMSVISLCTLASHCYPSLSLLAFMSEIIWMSCLSNVSYQTQHYMEPLMPLSRPLWRSVVNDWPPAGFQTIITGDGSPEHPMSTINGVLQWLQLRLRYSVINTREHSVCWRGGGVVFLKDTSEKPMSKTIRRIPSMLVDFHSSTHEMEDTLNM